VAAEVETVLVAFGFIFVLKAVIAVGTCVLFFHFVRAWGCQYGFCQGKRISGPYRRSSGLSNFLGFFGQQSQMNRPPIFDVGFGMLKIAFGTDNLPVASVAGGSREAGPGRPLAIVGWTSAAGELGLRIDFS
jgi:hypothetical protein